MQGVWKKSAGSNGEKRTKALQKGTIAYIIEKLLMRPVETARLPARRCMTILSMGSVITLKYEFTTIEKKWQKKLTKMEN